MSKEILNIASSQGIWTLLCFILIYYIMKAQEDRDKRQNEREQEYQKLLSELTQKFQLIHDDIDDMKNKFNNK